MPTQGRSITAARMDAHADFASPGVLPPPPLQGLTLQQRHLIAVSP